MKTTILVITILAGFLVSCESQGIKKYKILTFPSECVQMSIENFTPNNLNICNAAFEKWEVNQEIKTTARNLAKDKAKSMQEQNSMPSDIRFFSPEENVDFFGYVGIIDEGDKFVAVYALSLEKQEKYIFFVNIQKNEIIKVIKETVPTILIEKTNLSQKISSIESKNGKIVSQNLLEIDSLKKDFHDFVDKLKTELINACGGIETGKRNRDIPNRILLEEGKGIILKNKLFNLNLKMETIMKSLGGVWEEDELFKEPLDVSWENYRFNQMPLAAILPILSGFKNTVDGQMEKLIKYVVEKN